MGRVSYLCSGIDDVDVVADENCMRMVEGGGGGVVGCLEYCGCDDEPPPSPPNKRNRRLVVLDAFTPLPSLLLYV